MLIRILAYAKWIICAGQKLKPMLDFNAFNAKDSLDLT